MKIKYLNIALLLSISSCFAECMQNNDTELGQCEMPDSSEACYSDQSMKMDVAPEVCDTSEVDSMQNNSTDAGTFKTPLSTMVQFNALSAYMRKNISNIKIPILSLHPRDDDFSNISNSYEIIKKVKGRVDLVVLEDSYHIITLDKQRQVVVDRSVSFIEKIKKDIEKHNDNVIYKNKFRKV